MMLNLNWQPGMTLEGIEKAAILQAFRFYRGNKSMTSRALDISIRTLEHKLEKYQTDDKEQERIDYERRAKADEFALRQRGIPRRHDGTAIIDTIGTVGPDDQPFGLFNTPKMEAHASQRMHEGVRVESIANSPAQPEVPVPVRAEVQSVLPKQTPRGGSNKNR